MFSIDSPEKLATGLLTGLVFGFLLQRGGVTRYRTILGQLLWTDHTVLRTMLTAVVVGAIGIYAMQSQWAVELIGPVKMHVKGAALLGNVIGGIIFGVGMVVMGYCPGTGVAALGDGSRHAAFGVLGMLTGAALYAEVHGWINARLLSIANLGEVTLPGLTGLSPWLYIAVLAVAAMILFAVLRRLEGPAAKQERIQQRVGTVPKAGPGRVPR